MDNVKVIVQPFGGTQTVEKAAKEMQMYFAQTGNFRSADVRRVLGDPRETVKVHPTDSFAFSARRK